MLGACTPLARRAQRHGLPRRLPAQADREAVSYRTLGDSVDERTLLRKERSAPVLEKLKKSGLTLHSLADNDHSKSKVEPELSPKKRAALRKSCAQLIKRVCQVNPLKCDCGGTLRVISFITEHKVIRKILDHLDKRNGDSRAPPNH